MSNEERQRVIREAGFRPAEAETEERARTGKEAMGEEEAELQREAPDDAGESRPTPLAEDETGPPRPRR
jgi:hypothetical protein